MVVYGGIIASLARRVRWMWFARAGWYACAAVVLGLYILAIAAQAMFARQALQGLLSAFHVVSFLIYGAAALISFILAIVLFIKRPGENIALFLSYFLLVYGVVEAGVLASLEPLWPGAAPFTYGIVQPVLFAPLLVAFLCIFPTGHLVPHQTRWLVAAAFLYAPFSLLLLNATALSIPKTLYLPGVLLWFVLIFGGLYAQIYRYRYVSNQTERQQTKWVLYGFTLQFLLAGLLTLWTISIRRLAPGTPLPRLASLAILGWPLAMVTLPISLSFAMMRYRLYDIDILIKRTLVYGGLTASILAIYALSVGALGILFQAQGNPIIALLATGLVAALFQPLRERLQRGVNRLFYGRRDEPLIALSQLGKRLEGAIAPEVVLPTLVDTIRQTLKLPYVAISLRSGDEFRTAAESGEEVADTLCLPLNYRGETVAQLIAGPRGPGESFSQQDRLLLEHIAHQAGPSAYAVQLTEDLRQSRVRLVTAREEERRRLRRDLHDGLGPVLASQGLKMAAAGQLLQVNPAAARRLLEELTAQNEATVAEIRRLVYELRPAALDDLGLEGAVRDYASDLKSGARDSPRLHVDVHAPVGGLPPLPAAIEVAVYRISTEALTNVARHAQARRAVVSFSLASANHDRKLHLEITDDGNGLPADCRSGIGLISMRERAEEVGGRLLVESSPGQGTRVLAELPVAEAT